MTKIAIGSIGEITKPDCIQALVVEFIITFFFIFAGVGSAMTTDDTGAVHTLAAGMDSLQGVIMEIVLTFSLIFTVYATLVDPKKGWLGPLLTGLVVGANIMAGGPFSGASMNPARSFGPALVAGVWTDHWVYWVGPLIGGGLAGLMYENFFIVKTYDPLATDEEGLRNVFMMSVRTKDCLIRFIKLVRTKECFYDVCNFIFS